MLWRLDELRHEALGVLDGGAESGAEHTTYSDEDERLDAVWFYAPTGNELRCVEPDRHATSGHAC